MQLLKDKVAIVTGAAHPQGMGFAACRRMAQHGAKVVVTDLARNDEERQNLEARAESIRSGGSEALAIAVDITDPAQIADCVQQVLDRWGRIDVLFNNAGTAIGTGPFIEQGDREWDISYQVHMKGTANFCKAVIPQMINQGEGNITCNSSLSGLAVIADMAAYNATKFAVVGLTKSLAVEYGRHNIRVNAVCPGQILTQMSEMDIELIRKEGETYEQAKAASVAEVPLGRWGTADEVADAVVYLASPMASYVSGVALPVAGGLAPGL